MSGENPLPASETGPEPVVQVTPAPVVPVPAKKARLNPRFTFEAILIVLSVLLGFGVSEWRQVQVDQELAERVQRNLRTEIEYNIAQLEMSLLRHQQILELLKSADVSNSQLSGWDVIYSLIVQAGGGVGKPSLRKGSWDAAVSTGALRLLDYEQVAELSEIFTTQDAVSDSFDILVTAYQTDTFRPGLQRETVQVFRWTFEEMVNWEKSLLVIYKKYLEEHGEVAQL